MSLKRKTKLFLGLGLFLFFHTGARAQQNFFNVPSSDLTPKGRVFFQQQFNNSASAIQSSTTLCVGLGHNTEIGLNAIGLTYDYHSGIRENGREAPYFPFFMVNAQKRFDLGRRWAVSGGGQLGVTDHREAGAYGYLNGIFHATRFKMVGGLYAMSNSFVGPQVRSGFPPNTALSKLGLQVGFEQQLIPEKLSLQTDFISGKHALGEIVPGMAWFFAPHWVLSAGYQIPTFKSQSVKAAVVEITYVPGA